MDEDVELLERIAAGGARGERALADLYERYHRSLLVFLLRRRLDRDAAQDIVHDAFLRVWKSAEGFRGESKVSSWLHQIVKNLHLDSLRKSKRFVDLAPSGDEDDQATSPEEKLPAEGSADPLVDPMQQALDQKAFAECVGRQYPLFAQSHPEMHGALEKVTAGWSGKEIAEFLGRTETAARQYLTSCRNKLRTYLKPCQALYEAQRG